MDAAVRTGPAAEPEPLIETPALETLYSNSMLRPETLFGRSRGDDDDLIRTEAEYHRLLTVWTQGIEEIEEVVEILNNSLSETEAEWGMFLEHANLWREAEAEAGRFSSTPWETDVVPYEKIVLEQLKTRNFDEEEERHEDEEEICSVCLEHLYRGTVAALNCRHEFHADCIMKWLVGGNNFCPLCKAMALHH